MNEESSEFCGIHGEEDAPVTKGEFNRLSAQIRYYHLRPLRTDIGELKHMLSEQDRVMQAHIETDKLFFAKLAGAKWALWAIVVMLAAIIPPIFYFMRALVVAKVL